MAAGRLLAKIVVEGEDAIDLGARQIERLCDHWYRGLGHIAERLLQRMQDHQRRAFLRRKFGDDLAAACFVPRLKRRRHFCSRSMVSSTMMRNQNGSKNQ